jgi:hypothetical protein
MVGILPLASHRNAEFLKRVPAWHSDRVPRADGEVGGDRGAAEIGSPGGARRVKHRAGAYVIPPFNRVGRAAVPKS